MGAASCHRETSADPAIQGVVETALHTDNLARSTGFYREVLGLVSMTGDPARLQAFEAVAGSGLLLFARGSTRGSETSWERGGAASISAIPTAILSSWSLRESGPITEGDQGLRKR